MPDAAQRIRGFEVGEHRHEKLAFPEGFLWGTATAAYQVEGDNHHSEWWRWEKENPRRIREPSGIAVDHYHRYEEDLNLAKELKTNLYRFSIEWSRIVPHEGDIDRHELEHYGNMLRACRSRGIKTMVTLHQFTNPQWFMDKGGWPSAAAPRRFAEFVRVVAEEYADLVDYWITINEPMVYVSQGYVAAMWAPAKRNYWQAYRVYRHMVAAHKEAYRIIHQACEKRGVKAMVGAANNLISIDTYRKHKWLDQLYAWFVDKVWNHAFIDATAGHHDYLGVNYYFHQRIRPGKRRLFGLIVDIREEQRDMSDIGWEIFPSGLFDALLDIADSYKLPIIITENGIATKNEDRRARYIVSYVKELYHAVAAGIDLRGYCYWSLLDNYEWEKGFSAPFGLVEVKRPSLDREIKPSARIYAQIAGANGIPHDLLRFVGHEAKL
jgi:beta-glucosidase